MIACVYFFLLPHFGTKTTTTTIESKYPEIMKIYKTKLKNEIIITFWQKQMYSTHTHTHTEKHYDIFSIISISIHKTTGKNMQLWITIIIIFFDNNENRWLTWQNEKKNHKNLLGF